MRGGRVGGGMVFGLDDEEGTVLGIDEAAGAVETVEMV